LSSTKTQLLYQKTLCMQFCTIQASKSSSDLFYRPQELQTRLVGRQFLILMMFVDGNVVLAGGRQNPTVQSRSGRRFRVQDIMITGKQTSQE
jgi:hypothetical protein